MSSGSITNYIKGVINFVLYFSFLFLFVVNAFGYDRQLVRTLRSGQIEGIDTDMPYDAQAFLGIPYAMAPVGNLRWRAPQDPEAWSGIKQTHQISEVCKQKGRTQETNEMVIGSEDCLYLNVWRPQNYLGNLPVVFWMHGGAFIFGSTSVSAYNGAHIADYSNAIVVTANYRLGNLGWLYHPGLHNGDPLNDSGNFGLLDIVKGLQWVQHNIAEFGGNPNNVTVMGQSAGCIMINGLQIASSTWDLYDKAICTSGIPAAKSKSSAEKSARSSFNKILIQHDLAEDESAADIVQNSMIADGTIDDYMRSVSADDIIQVSNLIKYSQ